MKERIGRLPLRVNGAEAVASLLVPHTILESAREASGLLGKVLAGTGVQKGEPRRAVPSAFGEQLQQSS